MFERSSCGSTPCVSRLSASVMMSTLPVRSPLPNSVPSTRSPPAISASSVAATAVPRSLCGCRLMITLSRRGIWRRERLDQVGVEVGRRQLDRGRQVEHETALGRRLEDVHDGLADLERVVGLGRREALRRVLEAHVAEPRARLGQLADVRRALHRDVADAVAVEAEDDAALRRRGRVVEVHDRARNALQAVEGAIDQVLARLRQHDDRDVVGNQALVDEHAHEVEIGLRGRREADLDLLEADRAEQREHAPLALHVHRIDERLVAVAQVDRDPAGRAGDALVGPGAVGQLDARIRAVLVMVHRHGQRPPGTKRWTGRRPWRWPRTRRMTMSTIAPLAGEEEAGKQGAQGLTGHRRPIIASTGANRSAARRCPGMLRPCMRFPRPEGRSAARVFPAAVGSRACRANHTRPEAHA